MSRLPLLALLPLLACGTQDAPPGDAIGTFAFVASLDEGGAILDPPESTPRCRFEGAPDRIEFDGSLSHDPEGDAAWLLIDGTLREGTLEGATFDLSLPREPDGSIRGVPRRLPACTCDLLFVEKIDGALVESSTEGCRPPQEPVEVGPATCPRLGEDGELAWDSCGGICGTLREEVRFEASGCFCEVDGVQEQVAGVCQFVWALQGTRIGG